MAIVGEKTGYSPAFMNPRLVYTGTGDQINALNPTTGPKIMLCTADSTSGAVLLANKVYFRKVDNTLQVLNLTKHYHEQDDDDSGGLASEILYENVHQTLLIKRLGADVIAGHQNLNGVGATMTTDFDNTTPVGGKSKLFTGIFANNLANVRHGGMAHNWAIKSKFEIICSIDVGTQIVCRAGAGAEPLTISNDTAKKYGIEFCDSTGSNWQVFSSNGVRSLTSTSFAGAAAKQSYKVEHTPATNVKLFVGGTLSVTKTTDIPGTGASDDSRTMGAGVKTADVNAKSFYIWGMAFVGTPSDIWS